MIINVVIKNFIVTGQKNVSVIKCSKQCHKVLDFCLTFTFSLICPHTVT